jgi:hypothetical protein
MGREATCFCDWSGETGECKVLLESSELIIRGAIRRRVALSALSDVAVKADQLTFRVEHERIAFSLGADLAQRWAKAISAPPPSLAKKLGISAASKVLLIGEAEDPELEAAIAQAGAVNGMEVNVILACVNTDAELRSALEQAKLHVKARAPLWIIYPKGPGQRINEAAIRTTLRHCEFIDTKVASVSPKLTALRFVKREASL